MGLVEDKEKQFSKDMEDAAIMLARFKHLNKYAQCSFMACVIDNYCELNNLNYKKVLKEYSKDRVEKEKYMEQFIEL